MIQLGALQGSKKLASARQRAEASHGIEIRERNDKLGLVVIVLVVAVGCGEFNPSGILAGKTFLCLLLRRVRL